MTLAHTGNAFLRITVIFISSMGIAFFISNCKSTDVTTVKTKTRSYTKIDGTTKTIKEKIIPQEAHTDVWKSSSKEGWLSNSTAQALYTTKENMDNSLLEKKARERLTWLLLLHDYNVSRNQKNISQVLASSNLYKNLGSEKIYTNSVNKRKNAFVVLHQKTLKENWEKSRSKLEKKFPELKKLRKK